MVLESFGTVIDLGGPALWRGGVAPAAASTCATTNRGGPAQIMADVPAVTYRCPS